MIKKKKPVAARGKTTKKEAVKRSMKKALRGLAMASPAAFAKRVRSVPPGMKKAMTGSATGMGGAGLMAMARKMKTTGRLSAADLERVKKMMAKKMKPTGRINAADLMRVKKMMGKKTGGAMTQEQLKNLFDRVPKRGLKSPSGQKPVLDSKGNPVKNLTQKAGPGKPMSAAQKKQLERFKNLLKEGKMPKRKKKGPQAMIPPIARFRKRIM